jgi:bifunctional DNA-binding transcriptional regulator/antitoxin component of YhaV-PrlF toxin-antitoxin module
VGALDGPSKMAENGQVVVPAEIRRALGLAPKESAQFVFIVDDDDPSAVTMIPVDVFVRRYRRGESLERLERLADRPTRGSDRDS